MKTFSNKNFILLGHLLLVKPACIAGIPFLFLMDEGINILRTLFFGYLVLMFFKNMMEVKWNRLFIVTMLVLASSVWEVIATYRAGVKITDWGVIGNSIGILLFAYMGLSLDKETYLKGTTEVFGSYVIINTISVVLFPHGMYASSLYEGNYFLGYRTSWFVIYLLAVFLACYMYEREKTESSKKWATWVAVCAFLSMAIVWTVTGIFSIGLAALFYAYWKKKDTAGLSVPAIMLIEAFVFYEVIIRRQQEHFGFILENVFHKDVTLTARTRIWDNAIAVIQNRGFRGVGRLSPAEVRLLLGFGASHPHCRYLYITMAFGIVGIVLYLLQIYASGAGDLGDEDKGKARVFAAAFIAMMTAAQVESFHSTSAYLFPMLLIIAAAHDEAKLKEPAVRKEKQKRKLRRYSYVVGPRHPISYR